MLKSFYNLKAMKFKSLYEFLSLSQFFKFLKIPYADFVDRLKLKEFFIGFYYFLEWLFFIHFMYIL